jgi:hypothetical protein
MMFKKGIIIYKSIILNSPKNEQNNDIILIKSDYLCFIKKDIKMHMIFLKNFQM